ncbi:solute carrier family 15 member 4-like [Sycon ciliatum]|uniref:solute carrier family 15 member 4-like n=1 Tax=Sycon ciliatum TaxID=27933 RepID=UPI0031F64AB9
MSVEIRETQPLTGRAGRFTAITSRSTNEEGTSNRSRGGAWHPSYTILAVALLERIGRAGIIINLVQYLEYHSFLEWSTADTTIAALLCTKLSFMGAVFSGLLADTLFGHYRVLLASLVLQFVGSLLLLAATVEEFESQRDDVHQGSFEGLVTSGLVLFGLGVAGCSGTEIPLGVSQHALRGETEQKAKSFFPRYYWFQNVGAVLGVSVIGTVQVQAKHNLHVYGYVLPPVFFFLSIVTFLVLNRGILTETPSRAHPFTDTWRTMKEAVRVRWRRRGRVTLGSVAHAANRQYWKNTKGSLANWVRYAEESHGGCILYNTVARVHNFLSVIAILAAMVFCEVTIAQTYTSFVSQGNVMSLPIPRDSESRSSFYIPASFFASFNNVGVLLGIPLVVFIVYPCWQRFSGGTPPSHLKRITVGMVIAILAIAAAAVLEVERRSEGRWNSTVVVDHDNPGNPSTILTVSSVSISYQIPQYTLSGISEVFIIISALEFAYSRSPTGMKGISVGLVYGLAGLTSIVNVGVLQLIQAHDKTLFYVNGTQGKVHFYFIALGCIMVVGLAIFQVAASRFKTAPIYASTSTEKKSYNATYSAAVRSFAA